MTPKVLIVEPNIGRGVKLAHTIEAIAVPDLVADFRSARAALLANTPDFVVTNLRLGAYNGLHLVYTAASAGLSTKSIVYTDQFDPGLGSEVHAAGAFYETADHLLTHLGRYLASELPSFDRRDVWRVVLDGSLPSGGAGPHVASWFAH